ncbi:type I-D CRISPR-associated protein Cas5/Csc1 [Methanosarcina sp.]|uniref:type I-D CRISPR-associated protein Cas5/Csc1 n=1 Tax=Methanosarcina sp. TaxID=2213 RepID=UPI003BB717E5
MSVNFQVVECSIETLDRTLYASREVGELVDTGDYILSTALHYAFGFVSGKYVNLGNKPSYLDETSGIYKEFYITPAKPASTEEYLKQVMGIQPRSLEKKKPLPSLGGHSTTAWNARPHQYAVKNWKATDPDYPYKGMNLPKYGRERVLDQQNLFTSYILPYEVDAESIASQIPKYMRLGKKRSKARVKTKIIESSINEGDFISNHPFGIYDYESLPLGNLISIRMRPTPLVLQGRYKGQFICIPKNEGQETILPYKLEFLKVKR